MNHTDPAGLLDVYIGGGADCCIGQAVLSYYNDHRNEHPSVYYNHLNYGASTPLILAASHRGEPINIIGHSYGGTAAYTLAKWATSRGVRVDNLITIDPVGRSTVGGSKIDVDYWLNVEANPQKSNFGDTVATIGGKPSKLPVKNADRNYIAGPRLNHADFGQMLKASGGADRVDKSYSGWSTDAAEKEHSKGCGSGDVGAKECG